MRWNARDLKTLQDGQLLVAAVRPEPLLFLGMGRGSAIRDSELHVEPSTITLGEIKGAVIDGLRMGLN
jgi:hypothetical protein